MTRRRPHSSERHNAILTQLRRTGNCSVADVADELGVSRETVRRDIKVLEREGLLRTVHGGAVLPDFYEALQEPAFRERMRQQAEEKQAIANLIPSHVAAGDSLMLDSGSTNLYVAHALEGINDLLAITNNTEIARTLGTGGNNQVYLCGGHLRPDDGAVFGRSAVRFVEQFRVRKAILSVGAIAVDDGILDFSMEEAEFAQAIMARADSVIVVADHTKFGRQAPIRVCGLEDVHLIITNRPPPHVFANYLSRFENCRLVHAGEPEAHEPS
ncbi:transcriptional regulator, DeoR family [Limimonas halophila]|uniref:Transcriptional regulator, DeoR family n=1 Tax=Limimonas halophila TaxID=1082479 RepID=A0A1G7LJK8_9PROT|nr:DeoR/GlpR family DNA-binding transcription regulator [Limimonas halophila]SDF49665.1 transcriptional regulator, DeoR family [Limimonas halophila]